MAAKYRRTFEPTPLRPPRAYPSPMGAGGLIQRAPARVRVAQLRPYIGMAGLAGVLAFGLVIALRASAAPSHVVPSSRAGFPGWLSGPLPGSGPTLQWHEFSLLLIGLSACYR